MRRGQLSNEPAPVVALDWKILVDAKRRPLGLGTKLTMREGARRWLEQHWQVRFCVIIAGDEHLVVRVKEMVKDLAAEFEWFVTPADVRTWLRRSPQVMRLYTNDPALLGLDSVVREHQGWHEVPSHGL